jgi:hypothetical protein
MNSNSQKEDIIMRKFITLLFTLFLLTGCTNANGSDTPTTVYKCTSGDDNPVWTTVTTLIESNEDELITKVEDVAVLSTNVAKNKDALIEQYGTYVVKQQLVGIECSYEFSENDTVFTLTTVMEISKLDKDYLENDSIFAFINSRETERFIEIAEDSGFTCNIE